MFNSRSEKHELLKKVPLFSDLSKNGLKEIAQIADEIQREAGAVLAQQGDIGQEFMFILEGEARVEKDGKTINRLGPNDFFGEISIVDLQPRTASVIADTPIKLLVIHSRYFKELIEKVPGFAGEVITALCNYIREARVNECS